MNLIEIREYLTPSGRNPFRVWVDALDMKTQERIYSRIRRLSQGNFGVNRHLGSGMHEAIFDFGPGYRLYYGYHLGKLVLLLCGGDKSSQSKDIETARGYWQQYQEGGSR